MKATKTYQSYLKRHRCTCEFKQSRNGNRVKVRYNECPIHDPRVRLQSVDKEELKYALNFPLVLGYKNKQ